MTKLKFCSRVSTDSVEDVESQPLRHKKENFNTRKHFKREMRGALFIGSTPPPVTTHDFSHTQRTPALSRSLNMGLENDADLKRMREELKRERERVARLEKELKERMQKQKNSGARGQGR